MLLGRAAVERQCRPYAADTFCDRGMGRVRLDSWTRPDTSRSYDQCARRTKRKRVLSALRDTLRRRRPGGRYGPPDRESI